MSSSTTRQNGGSASGRKPPPETTRFQKPTGNPAGRPKGTVSMAAITKKVALSKIPLSLNGKRQTLTRLEIAVLKLKALAAQGSAAAAEELHKLRTQAAPRQADRQAGVLLVPAEMPMEEYMRAEMEHNKNKIEPGTAINLDAEEFIKAVRGEPTNYGKAMLAHRRKYRG